jgi:hypothetical protein
MVLIGQNNIRCLLFQRQSMKLFRDQVSRGFVFFFLSRILFLDEGEFCGQYSVNESEKNQILDLPKGARPGFEPGTSRTQSENHTPRPTSRVIAYITSVMHHDWIQRIDNDWSSKSSPPNTNLFSH